MNTPALSALAVAAGLVSLSGASQAAWGHSAYSHAEAYRHLQVAQASRSGAADPDSFGKILKEHASLRAFDRTSADDGISRPRAGGRG